MRTSRLKHVFNITRLKDTLTNLSLKRKIVLFSLCSLTLVYIFSLPKPLFDDPYSPVFNDRHNELLYARIAEDEQWRFPEIDTVPEKFSICIRRFEDRHFYRHPGFNPVSLMRAVKQNISRGEIVSGGSTITMQVIRLHRKNRARTISEKLIEIIIATRIEWACTKDEILALYASYAPFGGNVVGIDAASWRYFGRTPENLSWAESATLAVLPNAPALIHPGKNRNLLLQKRNRLLRYLFDDKLIDSLTYSTALLEPLPEKTFALPQKASHAAEYLKKKSETKTGTKTSIDISIQEKVEKIVARHNRINSTKQIHNAAVLVLDVHTGEVLAYAGNTKCKSMHSPFVDIVQAERSSGSILKPFLYASALYEGKLLPDQLLADIPTRYDSYTPKNFNHSYSGAVSASNALTKSLNIPAVRLLNSYGRDKFYYRLQQIGFESIRFSPDHYGLSLILGGAEVTLWDLSAAYASMARILNRYNAYGNYSQSDIRSNTLLPQTNNSETSVEDALLLSASSVWFTLKAMRDVKRPVQFTGWQQMSSSKEICWKTGTSFGYKDAWAVGVTPEFVVAVWAGNADGEGRPGIVGTQLAAPIMFDVFSFLPVKEKFSPPLNDLDYANICPESGLPASDLCPYAVETLVPHTLRRPFTCNYHQSVLLDSETALRVNKKCFRNKPVIDTSWFVLPPAQAYYFGKKNSAFKNLPDLHPDCKEFETRSQFEIIYPLENARIFIPKDFNKLKSACVFEAFHRKADAKLFWYIDDEFITSTEYTHNIVFNDIMNGKHTLSVSDSDGQTRHINFYIIDKEQ